MRLEFSLRVSCCFLWHYSQTARLMFNQRVSHFCGYCLYCFTCLLFNLGVCFFTVFRNAFIICVFFWFVSFAGVPEWSNGTGLGPVGLVPAQVQILSPALFSLFFCCRLFFLVFRQLFWRLS